jgi:hypothetical protein
VNFNQGRFDIVLAIVFNYGVNNCYCICFNIVDMRLMCLCNIFLCTYRLLEDGDILTKRVGGFTFMFSL